MSERQPEVAIEDGIFERIGHADAQLSAWVERVLPEAEATLGPPRERSGSGVSIFLFGFGPKPPTRGLTRPPLQLELRYLISTWAERVEEAHQMLGELALAALEQRAFEVELEVPGERWRGLWRDLGVPPRPAFVLLATLARPRGERPVSLVTQPLRVEMGAAAPLRGRVLARGAAGEVPLPGALLELPGLQLVARSDASGRFAFPALPRAGDRLRLRLIAKGEARELMLERAALEPAGEVEVAFERFSLMLRFGERPGEAPERTDEEV